MKNMLNVIQTLKHACGCQSTLTELLSPMQVLKKEEEKKREDLLKVKCC